MQKGPYVLSRCHTKRRMDGTPTWKKKIMKKFSKKKNKTKKNEQKFK